MGKGYNRIPPLQTSEGLSEGGGVSEATMGRWPPQLASREVQYDLRLVLFLSLHCWGENPSCGPQDLGYV